MSGSSGVLAAESEVQPLPRRSAERGLQPIAVWLLCCCGMIFVMVLLGGITRLTLSGLSITEWHPVTGIVPPLSHADWVAEFDRYKEIPQYRQLNYGMSLAQFKTIFMWEYVHRLWGRLIGFAYFVPLVWFIVRRRVPRRLVLPLSGVFLLGCAQGFLGWYMVESGLVHRVEVSQYRLTAHLALALAIYALGLWIALGVLARPTLAGAGGRIGRASGAAGASAGWRRAGEALIALVAVTICAGGFVAGTRAGFVYNTFPLMDGSFVPAGYARLHPFFRNFFDNVAAVQFDHRVLAMATAGSVLVLWLIGRRARMPRSARLALHALLLMVAVQFALGLSTLLLVVPTPLAATHQAGAVLLLTAAIVFRHNLAARGGKDRGVQRRETRAVIP